VSLEKLIRHCKNQDREAQEQLYRLYAGKLFGLCLKYSDNQAQAEDSLQDGFLTIFAKISQYSNQGSFEGWMKRIVINTCLQKHRSQKLYEITNEENLAEEEVEIDDESVSLDYLLNLIQSLPDRYRQVFNLYVMEGFSHKEIAKMLNISEGTSKSNLSRARLSLKEKIEESQNTNNSAQSL